MFKHKDTLSVHSHALFMRFSLPLALLQINRKTSPTCDAVATTLPKTLPDGYLPVAKRLNGLSHSEVQFPHMWALARGEGGGILWGGWCI